MAGWKSYLCTGLVLSLLSSCTEERVKEIRRETRTYENAYNSGDYQKFEELWDENAEYVDAESGETIKGRAAIVERFRKNPRSQIEVEVDTISFPSEHKVRETGTVKILGEDGSIRKTAYKALYERKNNKWLLTSVREAEYLEPSSHYDKLRELEWLGWRSAPIYYGYYDGSVTYQQPIQREYVEQTSSSDEWLPLGVFALSRDKGLSTTPNLYLQLALSKDGTLSGTYYNALTDQTYEAEGIVDEKSQRAAWKVVDNEDAPILETGIYDLTQSEAPVRVNFRDGRSQEMMLIRMEEPES